LLALKRGAAAARYNPPKKNRCAMEKVITITWPDEGLTRVPYRVFDDAEVYAREQSALFRGPTWNYLGLDCEIPKPGDYRLNFVGDTPVILCRDRDGEVHAMVNRCAHRGALVCFEKTGNRERFTCVYHNWTYDLHGNLTSVAFKRGVRGKGGMPDDFDNAKHGLERVRVASYRGIHFGTFSQNTPPVEQYLGPLMSRYLDRAYNRPMRVLGQHSQYLKNNWKLVMENVRDPYHASILHLFLGSFGLSRQTMKGEALLDDSGWHHIVYTKRATDDIRGSEYEGGKIPNMKSHLKLADPKLLEGWPEFDDGITNMVQTVFPTVTFQQISNCLGVRHLVPRGPTGCELFWTLLGYEDDEEWQVRIRARQANLVGPAGLVSLEDGAVTNFVQRGIRGSGATAAAVVELGGASVESTENRVTEATIRGFWKGYREVMGL
jgi:anthranilate 1,2-dioxygenase large subunit/terephthalate 1,2-dioxygenase oxygenase component alpha subunit